MHTIKAITDFSGYSAPELGPVAQTKGLFQGGHAEIDGLTPGGIVWVRVRTVGLRGVMGAWSDPAQIRVL